MQITKITGIVQMLVALLLMNVTPVYEFMSKPIQTNQKKGTSVTIQFSRVMS